jgi:hypothetical protein
MKQSLPVLNLAQARYECTFGRGCDGVCCRQGRPGLYPEEVELLSRHLPRILPRLRPEARAAVAKHGFLSRRIKRGLPMVRNASGWCIFFHNGCVLHQMGAEEGSCFRYKPAVCALFPLSRTNSGAWYVRQKGYRGEHWDLFCLDPEQTSVRAADSLEEELALAARFTAEESANGSAREAQSRVRATQRPANGRAGGSGASTGAANGRRRDR